MMRGKKGIPNTHRQAPGLPNGMHVLAAKDRLPCNCGGCKDGVRIPVVVQVRG
jgi:hypothetical protein